jgi:CDP-glycerol glycerophosphotransferase
MAIIARLVEAAVEKRFIETAWKLFCRGILKAFDCLVWEIVIRLLSVRKKVENNKILFTNFSGNYDCNPKYICEEILRQKLPYTIVWVIWDEKKSKIKNDVYQFPPEIKLVKRYSYDFYKELFSAKVIVDNGTSYASAGVRKKKSQVLINTFHGSLGIKMAPKEDGGKNSKHNNKARRGGLMTDYAISNSEFEDGYYRDTYFGSTKVLQLGHARNDIFFEKDANKIGQIRNKVYSFFGLDSAVKICLYAPTFRADHDIRPYALPYEQLLFALKDKYGGEWRILTRFHHQAKKFVKTIRFPENVISATEYPDIHEIMVCAEIGITDYSNWICEYIHSGKPGFLYATDIENYNETNRLFYDPLDKMPFPLATNGRQLIENIKNFDIEKYKAAKDLFLKQKGCMEDGHASERIVELIKEVMK